MAFSATFALLIPTVGGAPLSAPIRNPAVLAAVALTSIATDANGEDGVALGIHACTQPEDWLRRVD